VDREHVGALKERPGGARHVELLVDEREVVVMVRRGARIPGERRGSIALGDFQAVEIGGESIIVFDAQGEPVEGLRRRQREGTTDVGRGSPVVHLALDVHPDEDAEGRVAVVADAAGSLAPRRVVEGRLRPSQPERPVVGHQDAHGTVGGDGAFKQTVLGAPVGVVRRLFGVGVVRPGDLARGFDESDEAAGAGELEVRVELAGRVAPILLRGENDAEFLGRQDQRRERPFLELQLVVRQEPAVEVDGGRARVEDLEPVGMLPVLVGENGAVRSRDLGDENVVCGGRRRDSHRKQHRRCNDPDAVSVSLHAFLSTAARPPAFSGLIEPPTFYNDTRGTIPRQLPGAAARFPERDGAVLS